LAKKSHVTPVKQPTQRQISRWQKERKRQRFIFLIGLSVIVLIVGVLGYGYFTSQLAPRWQTAIQVNNTKFNTQYYVNYLRAILGNRANDASAIGGITPTLVGEIQDIELIKQSARDFDISVSEEDINQYIRDSLVKPDEKDKITETEIQDRTNKFISNLPFSLAFFKEVVSNDIFRTKFREKIESKVPTEAEQVKLSAIRLEDDVTATEVRTKLDGGGDFSALAKEYSKDENSKDKGGDIGWVSRGVFPELDEAAFSLPVGNTSQPIATPGGYFIIMVTEKKASSPISDEALATLKSRAFTKWIDEARKNNKLENYLVDKTTGNVEPKILSWIVNQLKS